MPGHMHLGPSKRVRVVKTITRVMSQKWKRGNPGSRRLKGSVLSGSPSKRDQELAEKLVGPKSAAGGLGGQQKARRGGEAGAGKPGVLPRWEALA